MTTATTESPGSNPGGLVPEPGILPISNSEVGVFKRCKRQWYLGYYRGLQRVRRDATGARALGDLVHAALEGYYKGGQDGALGYSVIAERRDDVLCKFPEAEHEIVLEYEMAYAMYEGYLEWLAEEGADSGLEVMGSEIKLTGPSPHPSYALLAKLDLLVKQGEFLGPLDFKTAQSLTEPLKTIHMREQGPWYEMLTQILWPDAPVVGTTFSFLKKSKRTARAKPPFYSRYQVHHNTEELRAFWNKLYGVLTDMHRVRQQLDSGAQHEVVCYPTPLSTCTWDCDFFRVCPLLDDPHSDAEGVLATDFEVGDPYARYQDPVEQPAADAQ